MNNLLSLRFYYKLRLGALLTLVLLTTACSVQRSAITGNQRAYGYSWEQEVQIGREADQQIQDQYGVYPDEELQQYVDRVAQRVLEVSHMRREDAQEKYSNTDFYFRVLDSPVVNAFALPGGYVYVTRGLMAHLQNEAQLAVVLGHEIGHVAARHASQRAFEQQMGQIALLGGAIAGQELLGVPGGSILNVGSQAAQFLFLSYSRDDERESDRLGVEYSARLQYEAAEGAEFFTTLQRLSEQSGQSLPTFQSTHPDPSSRAETIPELANQWEEKGYPQSVTDHEEYMQALEGLVYGPNPREGFSEDGIFYHPDLAFRFDYPDEWQLVNQRNLVGLISPQEDAIVVMQLDQGNPSAESSVSAFLSQEGIETLERSSDSQYGLTAYRAEASATTQEGEEYRYLIRAVEYGDLVYRFVSYSSSARYSGYQETFEQTAGSFQELSETGILEVQPVRISITRTSRSGTIGDFLPDPLPRNTTAEDVAILNQVEVGETLQEGRLIKIPRQ